MRKIQDLRKKAGLKKTDEIDLFIVSDYGLSEWKKEITTRTGAKTLKIMKEMPKNIFKHTLEAEIKGKKFMIFMNPL